MLCRSVPHYTDGRMLEHGTMTWTKEKFIKEFGEDPEDMFGADWENYVEEYDENIKI